MDLLTYGSMFLTAFLAATVLPAQSEILLAALLIVDDVSVPWLLALATAGNTLGSVVNWAAGRYLIRYRHHRWFPLPPGLYERAAGWYQRWGFWSLLLSWAPFVGDPLTVVAGALRVDIWRFTAVVLAAKGGRYLVVAAITLGVLQWR